MKRMLLTLCSVMLAFSLTACSTDERTSLEGIPIISRSSSMASSSEEVIEATSRNVPSAEPAFQEGAATSKAPSSISEAYSTKSVTTPPESTSEPTVPEEDTMRSFQIAVGDKVFSATLEENDAANSFVQLLQNAPVVLQMSDYSGFEKVGFLGTSLPESNSQITTQSGDIILYNGNQICVFYGSNSWSYTKLGRIDDLSGWAEALGGGDATLTFSLN